MADAGRRNPDWDHGSPKVAELSGGAVADDAASEGSRLANFRSESSVARKTAGIATWHPAYQGRHTNGNHLDREVMVEFIARPDVRHALAESIRSGVAAGEPPDFPREIGTRLRLWWRAVIFFAYTPTQERDPSLRRKKIAAAKTQTGGTVAHEVREFNFADKYGDLEQDFFECHHVEPLHVGGEKPTSTRNLAPPCSNCHRMIHRKPPWPTPAELRELICQQAGL